MALLEEQDDIADLVFIHAQTHGPVKCEPLGPAQAAAVIHIDKRADGGGAARARRLRVDEKRFVTNGTKRVLLRWDRTAADPAKVGVENLQKAAGQCAQRSRGRGIIHGARDITGTNCVPRAASVSCRINACPEKGKEPIMFHRRRFALALVAIGLMLGAVVAFQPGQPETIHIRIVFGLKDKEPRDWSGTIAATGGEVTGMTGWRFDGKDSIESKTAWTSSTHNGIAPEKRYPIQDFAGKPKGKAELAPWANGIQLAVKGPKATLTLNFADKRTAIVDLAKVSTGEPLTLLDSELRVERLPEVSIVRPAPPPKADTPRQDDHPALWVHYKTNKHYLAWVEYQNGKTRVLMVERDGPDGKWSDPLEVAGPGDHFRVALASTHEGKLWIVWASQQAGAWRLMARDYKDGKLSATSSLTAVAGPQVWHSMTTDNMGRAWLVWQGFDSKGHSAIHAMCTEGKNRAGIGAGRQIVVSEAAGNCWAPNVTADTREDRVWIGWDEYQGDNYRVRVRSVSDTRAATPVKGEDYKLGAILTPEESPLFQANIDLACDVDGRLWTAWDESGPQWGKDTGFLYGGQNRVDSTRLYASRAVRIKVLDGTKWVEPKQDLGAVLPGELAEYNHTPQLQLDGEGRMWLAFRHRTCRTPREDGWAAAGRWDIFATAYVGDRWLTPTELPQSAGRNDMRTASQRDMSGNVYFAYASDNRVYTMPQMPPRNHHVAVSRFAGAALPGKFEFAERQRDFPRVVPVHPKEHEQVAALRNYAVNTAGRTYKIYRGDLHRHTDISGDGPGDGSILDLHRYAIDAALIDFVLVADHNMGNDNEYCWWRTQQANDLYTTPGAFISMYGYERSVKYPGGHRNVIWAERGHRTLPLPVKPTPASLRADTAKLYEYLRKTNGICTAHTSASDQGSDWEAAHDPELEPFVELYQGYHTSYEAPGAPKAITDKSDRIHGPFEPAGFVSLALKKGYRLGFQSSSDHISTHVSYCCVLAENFTRKGLVDAMKKRHSYAATDNIILDVRSGDHIMGDEFKTNDLKLDINVVGTAALVMVEILRDSEVMHTWKPKQPGSEAKFTWTDSAPPRGAKDASYYYVRVTQVDEQMAWSSPMWVRVEK
jgi:hypothetical protein